MKENVHRGAHALTGLVFATLVIMFSQLNDRLDSEFLNFFLHLPFITTSLNNRGQSNDNDRFTTRFLLLRSFKIF